MKSCHIAKKSSFPLRIPSVNVTKFVSIFTRFIKKIVSDIAKETTQPRITDKKFKTKQTHAKG